MFKTRGHQILNFCDQKTRELVCCNAKGHNADVWFIYFYTLDSELAIIEVFGHWRRADELVPLASRTWCERRSEILAANGGIIRQWPRFQDLPEEERAPFEKWLTGSAIPASDCYYPWDYNSWKSGFRVLF